MFIASKLQHVPFNSIDRAGHIKLVTQPSVCESRLVDLNIDDENKRLVLQSYTGKPVRGYSYALATSIGVIDPVNVNFIFVKQGMLINVESGVLYLLDRNSSGKPFIVALNSMGELQPVMTDDVCIKTALDLYGITSHFIDLQYEVGSDKAASYADNLMFSAHLYRESDAAYHHKTVSFCMRINVMTDVSCGTQKFVTYSKAALNEFADLIPNEDFDDSDEKGTSADDMNPNDYIFDDDDLDLNDDYYDECQ